MLKMTKIKHELNSDPDMYILFEKGARGEISYISADHPFSTYAKFPEKLIFLPPDTHTCVCMSGACTYSLKKVQEVKFLIFLRIIHLVRTQNFPKN